MAAEASAADWLAAWGQIGGAVGTILTLSVAIWLARRDSRWRKAEQADRDVAQARLITSEPEYIIDAYPDAQYKLKVYNGSQDPIFDVKILDFANEQRPELQWDIYHPYDDGFTSEPRIVSAGDVFELPVRFVESGGYARLPDGAAHVTLQFTDARGLQWRRRDNEAPERIISGA